MNQSFNLIDQSILYSKTSLYRTSRDWR